jgi:hypothetical protein
MSLMTSDQLCQLAEDMRGTIFAHIVECWNVNDIWYNGQSRKPWTNGKVTLCLKNDGGVVVAFMYKEGEVPWIHEYTPTIEVAWFDYEAWNLNSRLYDDYEAWVPKAKAAMA